jgi:DNA primase
MRGFSVERGHCADAEGFTTWRGRRIRIRPDVTASRAVAALAHQVGHVLLHGEIARLERSGSVPCTGVHQVEADSVAYLAIGYADAGAAQVDFPDVARWAGSDPRARPGQAVEDVTARVVAAAAVVIERMNAASGTPAQPAPGGVTDRRGLPDQRTGRLVSLDEVRMACEAAVVFFRDRVPRSWVPGYLARRGMDAAIQQQWQAGYAPAQWDALTRHLRAAGHSDVVIEAAGLASRSQHGGLIDVFRDRFMLPIRSEDGAVVAFIGRATDRAVGPGNPKYLNSPATVLYSKGDVLFGLFEARATLRAGARPVLIEGPVDAMAVTAAGGGRFAAAATLGTALTARHVAALDRAADLRVAGVMTGFDPDRAGVHASARAYHLLVPVTEQLAALDFPAGRDPANIFEVSGATGLGRILAEPRHSRPLADLVVDDRLADLTSWDGYDRLATIEGQYLALREAARLIAGMPPAHVGHQVARLAARLGVPERAVTEAVIDAVSSVPASAEAGQGRTSIPWPPDGDRATGGPGGRPFRAQARAGDREAGALPAIQPHVTRGRKDPRGAASIGGRGVPCVASPLRDCRPTAFIYPG